MGHNRPPSSSFTCRGNCPRILSAPFNIPKIIRKTLLQRDNINETLTQIKEIATATLSIPRSVSLLVSDVVDGGVAWWSGKLNYNERWRIIDSHDKLSTVWSLLWSLLWSGLDTNQPTNQLTCLWIRVLCRSNNNLLVEHTMDLWAELTHIYGAWMCLYWKWSANQWIELIWSFRREFKALSLCLSLLFLFSYYQLTTIE